MNLFFFYKAGPPTSFFVQVLSSNAWKGIYTHTQTLRRYALCPRCIFSSLVVVFLCFPFEPLCGKVTCSFSSVGLPQPSAEAPWQTSAASFSVQAFQGITRAAWTAPGEFNSPLALVCNPPTIPLLFSFLYLLFCRLCFVLVLMLFVPIFFVLFVLVSYLLPFYCAKNK